MVDVTLTTLDKENLPHCYVAARFGDTQKLGRLSAEKVYRFPQEVLGQHKCAFIDVFQRVGGCKVNYEPEETDQLVTLSMRSGQNLSLRVNVGTSVGKKPRERDCPKTSDKHGDSVRQRLTLAKSYMAKHNLEMRLKSAVQAAMETLPDDPVAFIANQLLQTEGTPSEAPGTLCSGVASAPQGEACVSNHANSVSCASEENADRCCEAKERSLPPVLSGDDHELQGEAVALSAVPDLAVGTGTLATLDAQADPPITLQRPSSPSSPCRSEMRSPRASRAATKESVAEAPRSRTTEPVLGTKARTNQSEMRAHATEDEIYNGLAYSSEAAGSATSPSQPGAITVLPSQGVDHDLTAISQAADNVIPSPAPDQMQTAEASGSTSHQTIRVNPSLPEVILEIEVPSAEAWKRMLAEADGPQAALGS